jgi:predicted permease
MPSVTVAMDNTGTRPGSQGHPGRSGLAGLASLVINFVVPLFAYYLIHPHVRSSALALALAGAIPVAYTLVMLAVRRRLDPVGVVSVAGFGIGVLVSWASGGNALPSSCRTRR